ncbi:ImmA/IrrE family metallo-endopeptidase [Lactiplantibacillus pentosus]|uniref:ImmA/IrrE family metallo-endopeptidase n=1 Tax=Lactiplantibacillus pentosus TaxID=1589 RepID=UPI001C1F3A90|nr:ImmA/IrrE family metallo-endopeptidase [Lactiplantibacillus pentosus]MBU7449717.1 ImmA/IrrE family metallo-endopeptidase [Lactiplantibacillus sp. 7.2.4]MBU7482212.1 ImmA/IrrE family metallo-endopeptidase [Lactiplantibacillus pentosus]
MVLTRVEVQQKNIDWAFGETDLSQAKQDQLRATFNWLQESDRNYLNPTVKQLGNFASRMHVPFGNLLLRKIPETEPIQLAFRTKANVPAQVSLNTRAVIYEMLRKQAWFKTESGYADSELSLIGVAASPRYSVDDVVTKVGSLLTLRHFGSARELFNDLRMQIARHKILVMQKGGPGLGTNRPLQVEEVRAFVLLDGYAPLIFLNQKDSYMTRVFSLIHEFIHILRGTDELFATINHTLKEERFINEVTASFLMPAEEFVTEFRASGIREVAIRARHLGLISDDLNLSELDLESTASHKSVGGNPYYTALSFNDNRYMTALVKSQENGTLPPTKAAALLGVSTKMLDKTIRIFNEREVRL